MPEAPALARELLRVEDLHAWYGESHILHGMSFAVGEGEVVTLLGRNGAGKTTTLRAIMGIVSRRRGSVAFAGMSSSASPPTGLPASVSPIAPRSAGSSPASMSRRT